MEVRAALPEVRRAASCGALRSSETVRRRIGGGLDTIRWRSVRSSQRGLPTCWSRSTRRRRPTPHWIGRSRSTSRERTVTCALRTWQRSPGEKRGPRVRRWQARRIDAGVASDPLGPPPRSLGALRLPLERLRGTLDKVRLATVERGRVGLARALAAEIRGIDETLRFTDAAPGESGRSQLAAEPAYVCTVRRRPEPGRGRRALVRRSISAVRGWWNQPTESSLELGRSRAGAERSALVRDAAIRRVAVKSQTWHSGRYTVRARVRLVSTYANGRLIIGWTRRDRGLRIGFRGGDKAFAIGRRDNDRPLQALSLWMSDML